MGSAPAIRLAPYDGSWVGSRLLLHHILSRHDSYHSVGAAVDRVRDHPVDGRIVRPAPDHVAIIALGGQVQPMLDEPEQGLPDTAEFGDLVEDEDDGLLDAAIGILLEPVADLHEADRGSDNEFAAPGLLYAGRLGTAVRRMRLKHLE